MNNQETEIFKYLMALYKDYWDRNGYNRSNYDSDLKYYLGHRDPLDYPMAYNESFNKILPIIYTILSRFMEQVYQTGNIVSVKPRKSMDLENAKKVEAVLNFQLESLNDIDMQGGSYLTMMKWFFNALTFGKGIIKVYWRKEERIGPRRMSIPIPKFNQGRLVGMENIDYISQEMQTAYDGPYIEVLHNKLFLPHPQYRSIQQMPAVFLIYKRPIDYIRKKADEGRYKNLKELGWTAAGGAGTQTTDSVEAFVKSIEIEGGLTQEEMDTKLKTPEVDIIECYTKLILKHEPYSVGSGLQIKGKEEEAIVHIGNYKTILSVQRNIYGIRPLFDIGCYMQPEMYWDLGMTRLTKGIQEQANNLANLRMQNAMMLVNQMMKIYKDADIPPEALVWRPFGLVPVEDMSDIEPLTIPDYSSNIFQEQESFYDHAIQDLTGMYDYGMGRTPQRQERVGVVYGIQQMGEARAKLLLMSMDYLGIRPLLKYLMVLNTFHLPDGFEYRITNQDQQSFGRIFSGGIHPDFDFAARYTAMEPALGKQFRAQQLVSMAGLWQQNPWINQYQMQKTLMELMDIRESEYLLKQPQQMMEEMQQQQEAQMMSEQMMKQVETQGKLAIEQTKFQGKMALSEQEFRQDMVLEGIKQELENEASQ
ncbi:MAG: hypothetical protein SVY53_09325 [Chloroflexota bacterium]|nr:hypothetical protein [Chloroflexota bacterium]